MNKYSLYTLITLGAAMVMPASAMAQTASSTTSTVPTAPAPIVLPPEPAPVQVSAPQVEQIHPAVDKETRIAVLRAWGQQLIAERLNALARLKVQIAAHRSLNDTQRAALTADVEAKIAELTALSADIKTGAYDAAALKAKIKTIYTDHRIYAVFIPKIQLTMSLDAQLNHAAKIDEQFAAHPDAVTEAMRAKLADAKAKIAAAMTAVSALKPTDYPDTSKRVITETRDTIKKVHALFVEIRTALGGQVQEIIKKANETRQAAIRAAITARDEAFRAATIAYHTAMIEAQKLTDRKARNDAVRAAHEAFKKTKKEAQEIFQSVIKDLNDGWKSWKKEKKEKKENRGRDR